MHDHNILDFGASVTGSALDNANAIQSAINCAAEAGGGTVIIPAGRYLTASLRLYSHVRLYVSAGAVLLGSENYDHYEFSSVAYPSVDMIGIPYAAENAYWCAMIYAENAEDIEICGTGTIDGQGMDHQYFPNPDDPHLRRPLMLFFDRCSNIRVSGVTLKDPAVYAFFGSRSNTIILENLRVFSMQTENGDGLDFNGCSDVIIRGCIVASGDDAISLKTTYPDIPCRNILISNCILRAVWSGFRMGTESSGDMKDIILSDCIIEDCSDGIKIQDCSTGLYENIRIHGISMRNVHRPVFMTTGSFRLSKFDSSIRPSLGGIRNVNIESMTVYMSQSGAEYQRNCMILSGCPQNSLENISLRKIRIYFSGNAEPEAYNRVDVPEFIDYSFMYTDIFSINGNYPAAGIFMRHINNLSIQDCDFIRQDNDPRPLFWGYNLRRITLRNVSASCHCPFFVAEDSDVVMNHCYHNEVAISTTQPLSPALHERFRHFLDVSEHTNSYFDQLSATVDAAQACPIQIRYDNSIWTKNGATWHAELDIPSSAKWLLLASFGNVDVFFNQVLAGSCILQDPYQNLCAWALPLDSVAGTHLKIMLRWHTPDLHGGIHCQLPFGVFHGMDTGLYGSLRICAQEDIA